MFTKQFAEASNRVDFDAVSLDS